MNRGKLPLIPTPFALRVRQARMTLLPGLVLVGSLLVIAILWRDRIGPPTIVGRTDGGMAIAPSRPTGHFVGMHVEELEKASAGEPRTGILVADPKLVD